MRYTPVILFSVSLMAACTVTPTPASSIPTGALQISSPVPASPTLAVIPSLASSATPAPTADLFTQMAIAFPTPACTSLTQSQTEGPYYKPDTPERNSLFEEGMPGMRLVLIGYVLDENCQPLPNAWLDFWQADADGEYDNAGYRLRGHQYTDTQGRYYLETILPGLYASRPIEHIHVKLRPEGGQEITSQLYFPQQPVDGLTVTLEDRGGYRLGYFSFVVQR